MKALMVRTDFSLGESALKAEHAVKVAKEAGYTAVISADTMNIASVIPLQRAAGDEMAVICGVKLNVVDDPTYEYRAKLAKESNGCMESLERGRNYCFTALIKNEQGYRDICELMTLANTREQFYFVPRLALDQLAATYAKGNILLLTSDIGSVFQRPDFAKIISALITAGGRENFYSVVYPHPTPFYDQINVRAMKVASALKIEPVAFYPAYYEGVDDADIKDIAHMVMNNIKVDQPHRLRNVSSNRIEIRTLEDGSQVLYAPFSAVKGCSENGCQAIMRAREKVGGKFESLEQFEEAVEKRACNSRVRESLQKVGAFASIEPGSMPATDPERLRDQAELMGNLVIDAVKASRPFEMNPKRSAEVNVLMTRMAAEMGLGDELIRPSIGIKPKIMVILDNANGNDARTGYFMENGYDDFKAKLLVSGDLRMGDLYVTGVCKKVKDKEKDYTKDEIGQFIDFMREEINLVRPTYVLTCGSRATSLFNNKSKPSDLVGRKEYLPDLDVTVFYGFNPNILYFRPEEGEKLEAILAEVAETINK